MLPFVFPARSFPTRAENPFFAPPGSAVLETDILDVSVRDVLSFAGPAPSPPMLPKKLRFFSGGGNCGDGPSSGWTGGVLGPCAMMLSWLCGGWWSEAFSVVLKREKGLRFFGWPPPSSITTLASDTPSPVGPCGFGPNESRRLLSSGAELPVSRPLMLARPEKIPDCRRFRDSSDANVGPGGGRSLWLVLVREIEGSWGC
jgi:hypothetical protein